MSRTVVVGAGLAGVRVVQALRRKGYDAPITMIGDEPRAPYDRPPLSKEFLLGKLGPDDLQLTDPAALSASGVVLRLGTRAIGLDRAGRAVLTATDRIPFRTLIVATGSTPRSLGAGHGLTGVHALRTVDDATAIRAALAAGARVAVVGGGFIGAEVASAARLLGLDVTVIDPMPAMMIRGLGPTIAAVLSRRHADHGVRMKLGRSVAKLEGGGRVERLRLDDGSVVDADVVVVGIGVDAGVDWLADSGFDTAGGLACDASLHAGDGVYAVGDVARFAAADGRRRLEHWTNAGDQAELLADVLTGVPAAYDPMSYVWSDQLGTRLQVWGDVRAGDELLYLHGGADTAEFVAGFGGGGVLRAVVALGARREAMRARRLLHEATAWVPGRGPRASS